MEAAGRLPVQPWMRTAEVSAVLAALAGAGAPARFVGGCVRDALLERPVKDIDIATPEPPDRVVQRLAAAGIRVVPTGMAHGTVTAVIGRWNAEVTSLRVDVETDGRHARVAFTDDWGADAARRDLTINALYCDPDGTLYDPVGGLADLRAGRVRFVGRAALRICEDALRVLRFFRFHAWYGRTAPDGDGLAACRAGAALLHRLSGERVAGELLRLLAAEAPLPALALMLDHGILAAILPEHRGLERLAGLIAAEDAAGLPDRERRLAALIRSEVAAAEAVADRLRLANRQRDRLAFLAAPPVRVVQGLGPPQVRQVLYWIGPERFVDLTLLAEADGGGDLAPERAVARAWQAPRLPLRGRDALALGVAPGPHVGQALAAVEAWWAAEDFQPDHTACLAKLRAVLLSAGSGA
ncbi:MAG: CCA tRNA nucleotidyltransferase [Alphaproteobacteria bacterium]|nr:CCA tRNA nucleotidyltransferase [Alphaproteobacteria bacterium]